MEAPKTEAHAKARKDWQDRLETKAENVLKRQSARASRSPQQQINLLDKRLGKGKGAQRERARLQVMLDTPKFASKAEERRNKRQKKGKKNVKKEKDSSSSTPFE